MPGPCDQHQTPKCVSRCPIGVGLVAGTRTKPKWLQTQLSCCVAIVVLYWHSMTSICCIDHHIRAVHSYRGSARPLSCSMDTISLMCTPHLLKDLLVIRQCVCMTKNRSILHTIHYPARTNTIDVTAVSVTRQLQTQSKKLSSFAIRQLQTQSKKHSNMHA